MVCEKKLTNSSDPYTILQPIGIVSSSPTHFHSENIGLIRVTYDPPVSIRVNKYYSDLYSSVIHHWNRQLKPYSFPLRKNRVN